MKKVLLSAIMAASVVGATAQLADGTVAPNFTATDINGNSHTLYDYLDNGYTVVIDVSATWCGPCWSYHQTGALEDLWADHGPAGEAGVSGTSTDDVMVMWVEGDNSTGASDLTGGGNSQGDWTMHNGNPINYPIIDDASVAQTLGIAYFPTLYTVYPDRYLEESGQSGTTYANITSKISDHSGATGVDGSIFSYTGATATCADLDVAVNVQNKGDQTMPAGATVTVMDGSTVLGTGTTTQALGQFEIEEVTVSVTLSGNTTLDISVSTSNDANTGNDSFSQAVALASETNYSAVTVEIATDAYGSETEWTLKDGSGATVASGGPYADQTSAGAFPQTSVNVNLNTNDCYTLEVTDSWGDGMDAGYGTGYVRIVDGDGTLVSISDFGDVAEGNFKSGDNSTVSVEEDALTDLTVYPNPFNSVATVAFENGSAIETQITVTNTVGQIVINEYLGEVVGLQNFEINGNELEAGIYFVTIKAGNKSTTKRVVLNK